MSGLLRLSPVLALLAQTTTTLEEVPRVVGDPLPRWVVIGAGLALLVVVLTVGWLLTRRSRAEERR